MLLLVARHDSLPTPHVLETQIVPHKPPLPLRVHSRRSLLPICGRFILWIFPRAQSSSAHRRYLRRSDPRRLPKQVWFHILAALSRHCSLGIDIGWVCGHFPSGRWHFRVAVCIGRGVALLGVHFGWYTVHYENLSCWGGDCGSNKSIPRYHQFVPVHPPNSQQHQQ